MIFILCIVVPPTVRTDEITMNNGDRITGIISRMKDGVLQIKTTYAGYLKISTSDIKRINLDIPAPLIAQDGQLTQQQLFGVPHEDDPIEAYPIKEVKILFPTVVDLGEKGSFAGRANVSIKIENDSTQKRELDADFNLTYKFLRHYYSTLFQLEYDRNDEVPTKRDWLSVNQYAYYYDPQWFISYWYTLKQEKLDGLELRQTTGPGWGYKFETSPRTYSTTEFGVSYNYEDYDDLPDLDFFSINWVMNFERLLFTDRLTFYHKHQSGISMENVDKQLWHSWTGFRIPFIHGFITSFEYEIDYDSKPALREQDTNTTIRVKLGKEW